MTISSTRHAHLDRIENEHRALLQEERETRERALNIVLRAQPQLSRDQIRARLDQLTLNQVKNALREAQAFLDVQLENEIKNFTDAERIREYNALKRRQKARERYSAER